MEQRYDVELVSRGPNRAWTFLPIPFDVRTAFGSKARVAVSGTLNGFPFRSSLLPNGDGTHYMAFSKELQAGTHAKAGDRVAVVMDVDTEPRTVAIPEELTATFANRPDLEQAFCKLSFSHQREFGTWIAEAKRPETRTKRVEKSLEMLTSGRHLDRSSYAV